MLVVNGIRSCCVLPLITAQGPGLHFGSRTPYAYSGEDDEFMGAGVSAGGGGGR